jgi:hypothetical protein
MIHFLASAPQELQTFKIAALDYTGLSKDALHVYGGMTLFLCVRMLWRWRGGWMLAWLAVLALALSIEGLDMKAEQAGGSIVPDAEHWHDIWNTMVWPTVLLLIGRWLQPRPKIKLEAEPSSDLADQALQQSGEEPPTI